jgi:hypothetical protein
VATVPEPERVYAIQCPHCHKHFEGSAMPGRAARYAGFKCPHCRLFVPFERVSDQVDGGDAA